MLINDLQRGKIPYFIPPAMPEGEAIREGEKVPITEKSEKELEASRKMMSQMEMSVQSSNVCLFWEG